MLRVLRAAPAHVLNGAAVAVGLGLVQLPVLAVGGLDAVQAATGGAVCASIPHLVDRAGPAGRRALVGGLLGSATGVVAALLQPHSALLGVVMAAVVFGSTLATAWGPRAGALSFTPVLALVLSLAFPRPASLALYGAWATAGALLYAGWAWCSTRLLERRYRTLAVAAALDATARVFCSRASVLEGPGDESSNTETERRWKQIDEEAQLAASLQSARDLTFPEARTRFDLGLCSLLLRATELRDVLFASRLDLELLGSDEVALAVRERRARSLRTLASAIEGLETAVVSGRPPQLEPGLIAHIDALFDDPSLSGSDPRWRLIPAVASRQRYLAELVCAMSTELDPTRPETPLAAPELASYGVVERWPLATITQQLTLESPVFRHAARSALAVGSAYWFASLLPWAAHPHWLVLSVAVVLRGTFAQTLARRNQRVLGTAAGCVVALLAATSLPQSLSNLVFLIAAGTAHAFVNVQYTLTSAAATVMALLGAQPLPPDTLAVVAERLADTLIGAVFAWAFSYVLPSWTRRSLPPLVQSSLSALREYAERALVPGAGDAVEQRLAREKAYSALELVTAAVRRSIVEPRRVRPPVATLLTYLDHAQMLMAHLSSLRLLLLRRAEQLRGLEIEDALGGAREALGERLVLEPTGLAAPRRTQPPDLELPALPARTAALPWLLRRLEVSVRDATRAGEAARGALAALDAGPAHG